MPDYMPRSDADLLAWAERFLAYAQDHVEQLGITAADLAPLEVARAEFAGKYQAHMTAHQASQAARYAKDDSRYVFQNTVRGLVRRLQAASDVDDTERAGLGITVPDTIQTPANGVIATRPIGSVDTRQRLRHVVRYRDEATPHRRAKPVGVLGCEIWVRLAAVGEPAPAPGDNLRFLTLSTAGSYQVEYQGGDGGKMAHYLLRWTGRNGQHGPWSETLSATITA